MPASTLSDDDIRNAAILIVDDHQENIDLLVDILEDAGFRRLLTTTDPRRVEDIVRDESPDVVLLDLRMPYMDGFAVMERLRAMPSRAHVPILVLTAAQERETRLRALASGANDFLSKPFDTAEVRVRIRNLIVASLLYQGIAEASQRLSSVLEATDDAVAFCDVEGDLQFVNGRFAELFAFDTDALAGSSRADFLSWLRDRFADPDQFDLGVRAYESRPHELFSDALDATHPERRILVRQMRSVTGAQGARVGSLLVFRDVTRELEVADMRSELTRLRSELAREYSYRNIIGKSAPMQALFAQIERAGSSDVTVLIQGESGTGKELVAKAIHAESARHRGPFVPVNCAAIPEALIESELFGHERGAFTGATMRRIGRFEQAKGGTVFLDEIGDMPLLLQAKLLRVLQEREIQRVGGNAMIPVDVRVIAASNKNLKSAVEQGDFREDLYYRIAVFPTTVPALRERREDIPHLVHHFLARFAADSNKSIADVAPDAMRALMDGSWQGNVRELENTIQRAVILETSGILRLESLPESLAAVPARPTPSPDGILSLDDAEKMALEQTIRVVGNDVRRCAAALHIDRATFYRKLSKHGIQLT
ncbi:response regulator [Candidatus Poribacteria bacterium]|nr:response regulator [Candidatus Poribacteria bacterium]